MTDNQIARRCVVWFGQPTDEECACLARAGWRTRIGDAQLRGGVGMRRGDIVVAMADLRRSDADTVQAMGQLMANHPWLPWLALVSHETAAEVPEVERVLRASVDFFTAPMDMERLTDVLK
jgi:DNA-binding NtrC family response regulator